MKRVLRESLVITVDFVVAEYYAEREYIVLRHFLLSNVFMSAKSSFDSSFSSV